jgi:hypothetical protein
MVILKNALIFIAVFLTSAAWAKPSYEDDMPEARRKALAEQREKNCESTTEYIQVLEFLRGNKDFLVTETAARQIADKVSKGCTGAAKRFSHTLLLLKKSGVSDRRALVMAFQFARMPDYVQTNFSEIFTKSFLTEFFDYDFSTALALAFELSKDYKGDPVQVRNDFVELVRFCKDGQKLDLPTKLCAEYTIRLARLSQYFENGVREPFYKVFNTLRDKEEYSYDVKTSLDLTYNILKGGPKAIDNFFTAFSYASQKDGLGFAQDKAMKFAMKMAKRSYKGKEPVVIPGFDFQAERKLASEEQEDDERESDHDDKKE